MGFEGIDPRGPAARPMARETRSLRTTLFDLVTAIRETTADDGEVVATVLDLLQGRSGRPARDAGR
jgi:hypothetical protein